MAHSTARAPAATLAARNFEYLGSFADVVSATGEHCDGYSLALWRFEDRVIGLLDIHRGLCGDPPCGVIGDVALHRESGRLVFSAPIDGEPWNFMGRLSKDVVTGRLNGNSVRLERHRDDAHMRDFKPNQTLAGLCEFWSTVKRCDGVRTLCASLLGQH